MEYRPKYPDSPFVIVADIVNPESGKTYREENAEVKHAIPIGTLVEFQIDEWFGDGACQKVHARMWVVEHSRDCDKTPLYVVSRWKDPAFAIQVKQYFCGLGEESLKVVDVTPELIRGENALEWPEDEGR